MTEVTVRDLLALIGQKEVQIAELERVIAELRAQLAAAEGEP